MADSLDVSSTIGTWLAAGVAIIALVGIVGPWLALRASFSERNRALNTVFDKDQKYITSGIQLGGGVRLFRRVKAPKLDLSYDTDDPTLEPIISREKAREIVAFQMSTYKVVNTGWQKLCLLIDAHRVVGNQEPLSGLDLKRGGSLETVDSRTALVVSRYWIMYLGLTGRYYMSPHDRDGRDPLSPHNRDGLGNAPAFQQAQEQVSLYGSSSATSVSESEWRTDHSPGGIGHTSTGALQGRFYQGRHGHWIATSSPLPEVSGFTGSFRYIGHRRGDRNFLSTVEFMPHSRKKFYSFFPGGEESGTDEVVRSDSSLMTQFWLANGFLSTGINTDNTTTISIQDPENDAEDVIASKYKTQRAINGNDRNKHYFVLKGATSISLSTLKVATALNVSVPENNILKWAPYTEDQRVTTWFRVSEKFNLSQQDAIKSLQAFLGMDWDYLGFLTLQSHCALWTEILEPTGSFIEENKLLESFFIQINRPDLLKIFDWKWQAGFFPPKTRDYTKFDRETNLLIPANIIWLKIPLAVLIITTGKFRFFMRMLCRSQLYNSPQPHTPHEVELENYTEILREDGYMRHNFNYKRFVGSDREYHHSSPPSVAGTLDIQQMDVGIEETERAARLNDTGEDAAGPPGTMVQDDPQPDAYVRQWSRPTWQRPQNPDNPTVPMVPTDGRWKATQQMFRYHPTTRTLTWTSIWYGGQRIPFKIAVPQLDPPGPEDTSQEIIEIPESCMVLITMWAAVRCAQWLKSPDSRPLNRFVHNLDSHVLVV